MIFPRCGYRVKEDSHLRQHGTRVMQARIRNRIDPEDVALRRMQAIQKTCRPSAL